MINTKKVQGRRQVHYSSMDKLLADAERCSNGSVRSLGNWSPGQIFEHLARSMDTSIDGSDFSVPTPLRWLMTLLMKRRFLKKGIPAGFKAPAVQIADDSITTEVGLTSLRTAIARQENESERAIHPGFGYIGREGWNDFHLRHAEMHMSFLVE